MKTSLTIAGSDSIGGAGIQADIKTMISNGVYAMSVITALTAQNTLGVQGIEPISPEFIKMQLDSVFSDIVPDSIKIGMVPDTPQILAIAERLNHYNAKNIVIDPVMVATSGSVLTKETAVGVMKEKLFPLATVITPNIPEAKVLSGIEIKSEKDMENAAQTLGKSGDFAVLVKGGHGLSDANDVLYCNGKTRWYNGKRIDNHNTHGTGCTLSSAIASNLAKGLQLEDAVLKAKEYISHILNAQLNLGHGNGPLNHGF
ncbi:MAG: bifunctional hydroxymethylpyrimidine kinase/phosphomethylpyrimidine kinase [Clostridia bacterium]|nr:bifunctional hydroxymethylpyrimidine kinase/phosphomethylpyrimidine kinase [Clostridia bacterium]